MKISIKEWIVFIFLALACFFVWFKLGYPQFSFANLSVDKNKALEKAQSYLSSRGVDTKTYLKAVVFESDNTADRFLQKTLGFKGENEFIREQDFELFSWKVRFFKELQKEEYIVRISPKTADILSFEHFIEDIAFRKTVSKDAARKIMEGFLRSAFSVNLDNYEIDSDKVKNYENRTDYGFSWKKKGIYIPWKKDEGGAKLLIGGIVSGDEIRQFYKADLDVPEKFNRYIEKQLVFGENLYSFYLLAFNFMVFAAIYLLVRRKSNVVLRYSKKFYLYLTAFIIVANLIYVFNNANSFLAGYSTSASLASSIGVYLVRVIISLTFLGVAFVIPGLTAEALRNEVFPQRPYSSFVHYLKSTFYSRALSRAIVFGYILFFIMLGLQSAIFYFGQKYMGVWKEWFRLAQFSSAFVPFLSAFVVGITASLNEEIFFRLFGISWAKKYLKNTILAIVFISVVWGFGHSQYAIFPVWFRGIEVGIIGLLYGFIFIRYGLIPLIIAHYLFDVFWGIAAYILVPSPAFLFFGSVFVLMLPLIFAGMAYFINREEKERQIMAMLDKIQSYNLGILIAYVSSKKSQGMGLEAIKKELIEHNWDIELVNLAITQDFLKE